MALEDFTFVVNCSWKPSDEKDPASVISLGYASDPNERSIEYEGEIRHEINQENLIRLVQPEDDDVPCTLTVSINEPEWKISKLSIVSEARILELYGSHGEYITTSKGTVLGDSTKTDLYNSQLDVDIRSQLEFKFPGVKNSVWIYGIKLLIDKIDIRPIGTFDYNHVDEMLKSSKLPITDKAEQAKQFLQKYSLMFGGNIQKQPDPKSILKILESEYKSHMKPVEDVGRNISQYIANFIQTKQKKESEEGNVNEMKTYVDQSIKQLEERVENNLKLQLGAMEEKQNQKLDQILQLLANKS